MEWGEPRKVEGHWRVVRQVAEKQVRGLCHTKEPDVQWGVSEFSGGVWFGRINWWLFGGLSG